MAELTEGPYGPMRGRAGNLVGYVLRGKNYMRARPQKRRKKSDKEKANWDKFGKAQIFLNPLADYLRIGFKNYGTKAGGYKAAMSYTLRNAMEGEGMNQFVNPALVRISGGDLYTPKHAEAVLETGDILCFNWDKNGGNDYDQAMIVAYDSVNKVEIGHVISAFRKDGGTILQLTSEKEDLEYHIYLGFLAWDHSHQSHSQYLGKILVKHK